MKRPRHRTPAPASSPAPADAPSTPHNSAASQREVALGTRQTRASSCILVSSAAIAAGVPRPRPCAPARRPPRQAGLRCRPASPNSCASTPHHPAPTASTSPSSSSPPRRHRQPGHVHPLQRRGRPSTELLPQAPSSPSSTETTPSPSRKSELGDNDRLSAEVAQLIRADRLVSPYQRRRTPGRLLAAASPKSKTSPPSPALMRPDKGEESVGGMKTKLEAVKLAVTSGIPCTILDGRNPARSQAALAGKACRNTVSRPRKKETLTPCGNHRRSSVLEPRGSRVTGTRDLANRQ